MKKSKVVKKTAPKAAKAPAKRTLTSGTQACLFPTAIGDMAIAWREDSVVGVFLPESSKKKLLESVRKRTKSSKLQWTSNPPAHVGHIAAQIRAQLRGEPQEFSLERFTLKSSPFQRKVYECSQRIPSGKVLTYRELALEAGSPKAFRAVGQAMAKNPFPIVIPCHRVVGTGKSAGGFSAHGGLATKARILKLELPLSNEPSRD